MIAAQGSPWPWQRKEPRDKLIAATGSDKLPAVKLPDGTVLTHSRKIIKWVKQQA